VPLHTEARIQQLCSEALSAKNQADVERIVRELRAALEEHIRLAKDSLEGQVNNIAVLSAASKRPRGLAKA